MSVVKKKTEKSTDDTQTTDLSDVQTGDTSMEVEDGEISTGDKSSATDKYVEGRRTNG